MISQKNASKQSGDTIVEVLIAVVVISSMIVGAFSIANKSSQQIRSSQERSEATGYTTAALEQLKSKNFATNISDNIWYCYKLADAGLVENAYSDGSKRDDLPPLGSSDDQSPGFYNANCISSPGGGVGYVVFIKRVVSPTDPTDAKYLVETRWDGLGGNRQQQKLTYRSE